MFKSKTRLINIPQSEHGRLAGVLASLWGNKAFERPALDFAAFVAGVTLHDWNYALVDTLPIMEADETEWLATACRGVEHSFANPITDIVVKLHLKRLLNTHNDYPERQRLVQVIDRHVAARLPQTGFALAEFIWADKITRFCDMVAFDFSFEQPTTETIELYACRDSAEITSVTYRVKENGVIQLDPWPLSVSAYSGFVLGYQRAGYPDNLCPEVIEYHLTPQEKL